MLDSLVPGVRYVKYLVPIFALIVFTLNYRNSSFNDVHPVFKGFVVFVVWSAIIGIFMNGELNLLGLNDLIFILSYVVPLGFFYTKSIKLENVFLIYLIFFIISCFGIEYQEFSIQNSTAPFESAASFVFGAFFLYFMFTKNKLFMLLALVMMFLSLKRIALLGVLVCVVVHFLPLRIKSFVLSKFSFLFLNAICVAIILGLGFGLFDDLIIEFTGLNVHHFTMGRFSHYQGVVQEIQHNPWSLILGNGIGTSYSFASIFVNTDYTLVNLHSDTLKILFESGVFAFVYFFVSLGKAKRESSKLILLFVVILFFTDNVLIYLGTMFFIFLIFLKLEEDNRLR